MLKDERDLLEVLKFELGFLEDGGYGRSVKTPWRPQFIFEDSPTCINYNSRHNPRPCSECSLMQLVPSEFRSAKAPCRHIPLNESGETLDSIYRYDDEREITEAVSVWLRATIRHIEEARRAVHPAGNKPPFSHSETVKGTPLYQSLHPKCANPACPTAFHWTSGGKFFRFRPNADSATGNNLPPDSQSGTGIHGVRHYWLCELCSSVFTLMYDKEQGVLLNLLWPELPAPETHKVSAA